MGIRKYKPTTPGRRGASGSDFSEITRSEPEKSLVRPLHSKGGRNVHGRVTARHQGADSVAARPIPRGNGEYRRDDRASGGRLSDAASRINGGAPTEAPPLIHWLSVSVV